MMIYILRGVRGFRLKAYKPSAKTFTRLLWISSSVGILSSTLRRKGESVLGYSHFPFRPGMKNALIYNRGSGRRSARTPAHSQAWHGNCIAEGGFA